MFKIELRLKFDLVTSVLSCDKVQDLICNISGNVCVKCAVRQKAGQTALSEVTALWFCFSGFDSADAAVCIDNLTQITATVPHMQPVSRNYKHGSIAWQSHVWTGTQMYTKRSQQLKYEGLDRQKAAL